MGANDWIYEVRTSCFVYPNYDSFEDGCFINTEQFSLVCIFKWLLIVDLFLLCSHYGISIGARGGRQPHGNNDNFGCKSWWAFANSIGQTAVI